MPPLTLGVLDIVDVVVSDDERRLEVLGVVGGAVAGQAVAAGGNQTGFRV